MIQPLGTRLLVEEDKLKLATTDAGIIIGEERVPQSVRCRVLASAKDCTIKPGEIVYIAQFSLTECRENSASKTLIAHEEDVLGVEANEPTK